MLVVSCAALLSCAAVAQDNYEVQVYPYETVAPRATMVELHSNFTASGRKEVENGVRPTNHAIHETIEITHGWNDWFETGFYIFTSARSGEGGQWVGDHIRPRVRVPEKWKWPVGVRLSTEFGYQRPAYSGDTWTLEIRPIVDKTIAKWYLAFNPTIERALVGLNTSRGFEFAPNAKVGYSVIKQAAIGLEYYGGLGPIGNFDPLREQAQQIVPAVDLDVSPKWEINFGVGVGVTRSTDHMLIKGIIGYRFSDWPWVRRPTAQVPKSGK